MPTALPQAGAVIDGKFQVEKLIAAGGMGAVLSAIHLTLNQRVAIKMMLPQVVELPGAVARFQREAQAAATIQSEHVVRIMDVGVFANGAPYMVMEHLVGKDLGDIVGPGTPLPPAVAADYLLQACEAMAEAHKRGIVHRDLKPGNLFLSERADGSPLIKVLDFGISKTTEGFDREQGSLTATSAMMGSPLYMSPEQVRSAKNVDHRTDIWALGIILFEFLTGDLPFEAETASAACAMIVVDPPIPLRFLKPELPERLEELVLKCLEKDPDKRFQSVSEFAAALAAFGTEAGRTSAERVGRVLEGASEAPTLHGASIKLDVSERDRAGALAKTSPPSTLPVLPGGRKDDDYSGEYRPRRRTSRLAFLVLFVVSGWGIWRFRDELVSSATNYLQNATDAGAAPLTSIDIEAGVGTAPSGAMSMESDASSPGASVPTVADTADAGDAGDGSADASDEDADVEDDDEDAAVAPTSTPRVNPHPANPGHPTGKPKPKPKPSPSHKRPGHK